MMHTPQLADKLRRALLQAAIEGKLTERESEDGHAQDLLKQIQAEKATPTRSLPLQGGGLGRGKGRLKKSKGLPEISEDEKPFEIPENWVWVRLGEIFSMQAGKFIKADDISETGEYPCFGGNGMRGYTKTYNREGHFPLIGRQGALCGNIKIANGKFYATEHAVVVETFADCNPLWAAHFLTALDLNQYATSTAQPGLSVEKISVILIPLPPLAEQARIVAKLDALLAETDALKAQESALADAQKNFPKMLRASLLQAAIEGKLTERESGDGHAQELLQQIQAEKATPTRSLPLQGGGLGRGKGRLKKSKGLPEIGEDEKPFAIPENWVWVRLGEIGETNIGLTYDKKDISSEGTIVLRSGNIQNDKIDLSDVVKINSDIPLNKMCQKGDILICARNGSKSLVGKAAIINEEGFSFGAFMAIFRSPFNPYVFYYLHSPLFRAAFDGVGTTTINQITQDNLRNRLIPLPPLAEQARIVAKLDALLAQIESLENLS